MAAAKVTFHPDASEDYAAAFAWYYSRGPAIGSDFEREVERGIRLISANPLRWPRFDALRRRFVVRKFPYSIIFELHDGEVVVLAVAHGRRQPYYWRSRITE